MFQWSVERGLRPSTLFWPCLRPWGNFSDSYLSRNEMLSPRKQGKGTLQANTPPGCWVQMVWSLKPLKERGDIGSPVSSTASLDATSNRMGCCTTTGITSRGSYYHRLVARQGQLHKCPHLVGVALPRWPQVTPSESRQVSQKEVETPATSSSVPSTGASEAQGTRSDDVPAPMETGGVGDGQSWVDQIKASADDEFWRDRPTKCCWSQSRRQEDRPTLPFPLQDNEGRCASAQQLYQHAGEQP